jgi:hypothetical protein
MAAAKRFRALDRQRLNPVNSRSSSIAPKARPHARTHAGGPQRSCRQAPPPPAVCGISSPRSPIHTAHHDAGTGGHVGIPAAMLVGDTTDPRSTEAATGILFHVFYSRIFPTPILLAAIFPDRIFQDGSERTRSAPPPRGDFPAFGQTAARPSGRQASGERGTRRPSGARVSRGASHGSACQRRPSEEAWFGGGRTMARLSRAGGVGKPDGLILGARRRPGAAHGGAASGGRRTARERDTSGSRWRRRVRGVRSRGRRGRSTTAAWSASEEGQEESGYRVEPQTPSMLDPAWGARGKVTLLAARLEARSARRTNRASAPRRSSPQWRSRDAKEAGGRARWRDVCVCGPAGGGWPANGAGVGR